VPVGHKSSSRSEVGVQDLSEIKLLSAPLREPAPLAAATTQLGELCSTDRHVSRAHHLERIDAHTWSVAIHPQRLVPELRRVAAPCVRSPTDIHSGCGRARDLPRSAARKTPLIFV